MKRSMILIWDCTLFLGFYTSFWSYDFRSATRLIIVFVVVFALNILRQIFAKRSIKNKEEYFMLIDEYSAYQVYYKAIVMNLVFADPEILLKKLAEMTFAGKFTKADEEF